MDEALITSPVGILTMLTGVASFFLFLEKSVQWKVFELFPALLFIATAPIVAAYHNRKLVPASILMALIGYAIGNCGAFAAAWLCWLVS